MSEYRPVHTIRAHVGAVHVARYNVGGRYLLTGGADQQVCLWNARSAPGDELDNKGRSPCIQRYSAHSYEVQCLDIAPDNARFASGGADRAVLLWDVGTGHVLRRFSAHYGRIHDVRFAGARDEGSVLLTAGADKVLRAYDLRASGAWRPIWEQSDARDAILALGMSNGVCVHTGSVDGVVRTYDVRRGVLRSDVLDQPVTSLAPTRDGAALLVSTLDSTLRLLDQTDGSELQRFRGHKNTAFRCHAALSVDEAQVLAGDETGSVHGWDLLSGRRDFAQAPAARPSSGAGACILWTEANPDTSVRELVSASSTGAVHTWARAPARP